MSKFLYPIYKLKTKSYIKWWLYHKKAGGSGVLSEILEGFSFNLANTLNRKFKLFEIEGNSVQDGSPSPDNEVPIYSAGDNENLLENKAITQTINGVTFTVNKDGSVMANGTATTNTTFKINNDIVPKNISNLILSGCPNNGSLSTYDLKIELYKNSVWTKVLYDLGNGVDTGDLSKYTSCTISITIRKDYNANNLIFKPKLEKGNKATPYSPYGMGSINEKITNADGTEEQDYSIFVQQPMRSIGDVRDGFVKKSDGWYERHYIGEKILNGTEIWGISGNQNYFYYANNDFPTISGTGGVLPDMKCNYYQISTYNHIYNANDDYGVTLAINNNHFLALRNKDITTIAELKTWLSTHNVVVQYLLAEPLDLPCTPEQVQQLENKPSTYKDFTIIQSQDETPAYLKIQYYKEG